MNLKSIASALFVSSAAALTAGTVTLSDLNFSFQLNGTNVASGLYEVRWGTVSSGVFTPLFGNTNVTDNGAYIDTGTPELLATFSAADNNAIASGAPLALSLSTLVDDSSYALATNLNSIVLTDPLWVAGTFTLVAPDLVYNFSTNTAVSLLTGQNPATSFAFNGGNETINIVTGAAIPEPSTFAALAGVSVLGLAALRRRRA